jgi:isopentenyldiphosphate isomerase
MAERIPRLDAKGVFTQLDTRGNFVGITVNRREAEMNNGNVPVSRVFLFRDTPNGREVLLQQRGDKPLWRGRFDASIVETGRMNPANPWEPEHPKEIAKRGLKEELTVQDVIFDNKSYQDTWEGKDYPMKSFITTYTASYNGPFTPTDEVADVKWVAVVSLQEEIESDPDKYTPSLREFVSTHLELFK